MSEATEARPDDESHLPERLPVLPLREAVVFPLTVSPIRVRQERSVKLVEEAMRGDRRVALALRREPREKSDPIDVHRVGTAGVILQLWRAPDRSIRLTVQGLERIRLGAFEQTDPYIVAKIEAFPVQVELGIQLEAEMRTLRELFRRLAAASPDTPAELPDALDALADPLALVHTVATLLPIAASVRQEILELDSVTTKVHRVTELLQHEIAVRELGRTIAQETEEKMSKQQRDFLLREQLRTIQKQLGDDDEGAAVKELGERLAPLPLSPEVRKEVDRELERLGKIPEASPENGIVRTFLEWIASLPWGKTTGGPIDVARARQVLDADHHDLEKIKERILEYLAVKKLRAERGAPSVSGDGRTGPATREPVLCFVGPPGVGKTSLGQSIARAMGRKFVRVSLGGVHDEAEIRGHRRTYIGAIPGRIIQALRRAETSDPVFMLDEVDKLGRGFHGDPAAALLETLDPAQNHTFVDTYLGVPFDLSRVLFLCTANEVDPIPAPLLDRMEIVHLAGYTEAEKVEIARRHLLPRVLDAHGVRADEIQLDEDALREVVRSYTREAGVRGLERALATVVRKVARRFAEGEKPPVHVAAADLAGYLGRARFLAEVPDRTDRPGVATGLAWTPAGGDVLFVEATVIPADEERFILTGMLGDVMRESAQAALSYVRANAATLGIDPRAFEGKAIHVHVPAGAIPKDGPSAGITIATALASVASGRPVRSDVAMTGETTLRGKVLPVGGIKEKVLAAHRAGVKEVILSKKNEPDLEDVPAETRAALRFVLVDSVEEAIREALEPAAEAPGLRAAA